VAEVDLQKGAGNEGHIYTLFTDLRTSFKQSFNLLKYILINQVGKIDECDKQILVMGKNISYWD